MSSSRIGWPSERITERIASQSKKPVRARIDGDHHHPGEQEDDVEVDGGERLVLVDDPRGRRRAGRRSSRRSSGPSARGRSGRRRRRRPPRRSRRPCVMGGPPGERTGRGERSAAGPASRLRVSNPARRWPPPPATRARRASRSSSRSSSPAQHSGDARPGSGCGGARVPCGPAATASHALPVLRLRTVSARSPRPAAPPVAGAAQARPRSRGPRCRPSVRERLEPGRGRPSVVGDHRGQRREQRELIAGHRRVVGAGTTPRPQVSRPPWHRTAPSARRRPAARGSAPRGAAGSRARRHPPAARRRSRHGRRRSPRRRRR